MGANREHKNTLFTTLFSEPEQLCELYNAIAGTNYNVDTPIEINTLEYVFSSGPKNGVSFIIDGRFVVFIEHQSTLNENMPLRIFLYIARVYERIIDSRAAYRRKLLKIPTPEFIVLYNGVDPFPPEKTLRLSDAFIASDETPENFGSLELTVRVVNINPDGNKELLGRSKTLKSYSALVERIRHNQKTGMELYKAISETIKWGVENGILSGFLARYKSEVQNMLMTEFDIDIAKEVWQEEAFAEGHAEGRAEEKRIYVEERRTLISLLRAQGVSDENIAEATGYTLDEIQRF
jgi:predicted transposase/invertase (TIGR01784 family)